MNRRPRKPVVEVTLPQRARQWLKGMPPRCRNLLLSELVEGAVVSNWRLEAADAFEEQLRRAGNNLRQALYSDRLRESVSAENWSQLVAASGAVADLREQVLGGPPGGDAKWKRKKRVSLLTGDAAEVVPYRIARRRAALVASLSLSDPGLSLLAGATKRQRSRLIGVLIEAAFCDGFELSCLGGYAAELQRLGLTLNESLMSAHAGKRLEPKQREAVAAAAEYVLRLHGALWVVPGKPQGETQNENPRPAIAA
ncbi:hypothetical protein DB347_20825 [Opitutaceae bacterium EW11]|nr:hypothetical protein DB347_20825 [Opitutaceae bacterium EW11]